jgi:hypothetical protein
LRYHLQHKFWIYFFYSYIRLFVLQAVCSVKIWEKSFHIALSAGLYPQKPKWTTFEQSTISRDNIVNWGITVVGPICSGHDGRESFFEFIIKGIQFFWYWRKSLHQCSYFDWNSDNIQLINRPNQEVGTSIWKENVFNDIFFVNVDLYCT